MTTVGKSQGAAIDIGEVAAPPFVRLPVPQTMFAERASRLRTLASGHALADALAFFAAIAEAQDAVQNTLAPSAPAGSATVVQALEHGMPPLNRYTWTPDRDFGAIAARSARGLAGCAMPASAEVARAMVAGADDAQLDRWAADLLATEAPPDAVGVPEGYVIPQLTSSSPAAGWSRAKPRPEFGLDRSVWYFTPESECERSLAWRPPLSQHEQRQRPHG
jgi:formate dehydrogenase accessory protein FdhE